MFVFALLASTAVYAERGSRYNRDNDTATSTKSELQKVKNRIEKSTDASCVVEAISDRENSLITAWSTLDTQVVKILETRKEKLASAWSISDTKERKKATKEILSSSKKERKEAASEYKKMKKETWAEFKEAARACGTEVGSEAAGESESSEKIEI